MREKPTPTTLETAADLINVLGGPNVLAPMLGVTAQAICNMRARGSFPGHHWPALIRAAEARGIASVTLEWLAGLFKRAGEQRSSCSEGEAHAR